MDDYLTTPAIRGNFDRNTSFVAGQHYDYGMSNRNAMDVPLSDEREPVCWLALS